MAVSQAQVPTSQQTERLTWHFTPAIALVLVGLLTISAAIGALVLLERDPVRTTRAEPGPVHPVPLIDQDGPWQRVAIDPPISVTDLRATSFGLVAAAGEEGIWISEDGTEWHQSMEVNSERVPPDGATATAATPPSGIWESVEAIAEFNSALYAFGRVIHEMQIESEAWLVSWRSNDGIAWERIDIARNWDQIMDVATGPDGLILFVRGTRDVVDGSDCCFASIYRSRDGWNWERLDAGLSGLDTIQIWAATAFDGGYLAIGSDIDRDIVLRSTDAIHWQRVTDWRDAVPVRWRLAELHRSAWSIVDLFTGPEGVVAVLYSEIPHSLVLLVSVDGEEFTEFASGNRLLTFVDHRQTDWPPLTAPEGAVDGEDLVLLGEWFPWSENEPCTHLWRWSPEELLEPVLQITIRE